MQRQHASNPELTLPTAVILLLGGVPCDLLLHMHTSPGILAQECRVLQLRMCLQTMTFHAAATAPISLRVKLSHVRDFQKGNVKATVEPDLRAVCVQALHFLSSMALQQCKCWPWSSHCSRLKYSVAAAPTDPTPAVLQVQAEA